MLNGLICRTAAYELFVVFFYSGQRFQTGRWPDVHTAEKCKPIWTPDDSERWRGRLLSFSVFLPFVSSSSIGRTYPRRRSLLCFLLFIVLVAFTAGLMVSVCKFLLASLRFRSFSWVHIILSLSGWYVEAGPELQRNLRFVGSADPPCFVHCGTNHLLDMFENKQPHIQHHVVRRRGEGARKWMAKLEEAKWRRAMWFKKRKSAGTFLLCH